MFPEAEKDLPNFVLPHHRVWLSLRSIALLRDAQPVKEVGKPGVQIPATPGGFIRSVAR